MTDSVTHADLALGDQADTIVTLEDRIVALTADVDSYRRLAQVALGAVADLTKQCGRLRERVRDQVGEIRQRDDEIRRYTGRIVRTSFIHECEVSA